MDVKQLIRGYKQTCRHLHTAQRGADGWKIKYANADWQDSPSVYVYLFDPLTGFVWLAQVPRDEFVQVSTQSSKGPEKPGVLTSAILSTLKDAVKGSPPERAEGTDWEERLALLLSAYAGKTQVWKIGNALRDGGHFIVICYRHEIESSDAMVRPFALSNTENKPLSYPDFMDYTQQVIELDQSNHPEWFSR